MKLVCPSCGATHSAEAWQSNAHARLCLKLACELPPGVSRRAIAYLALFRAPSGRGLSWSRALRLLRAIELLVKAPHISWQRKPARPNAPAAWAQALERIIENPPRSLPLKSHGYLTAIAYEIADELDKSAEDRRIAAERNHTYHQQVRPDGHDRVSIDKIRALQQKLRGATKHL